MNVNSYSVIELANTKHSRVFCASPHITIGHQSSAVYCSKSFKTQKRNSNHKIQFTFSM